MSAVSLRAAERIADAVLYEGYVLYPYRASAPKNRFRWQVGLVMPRAFAEATGSDPWWAQTECLAEPGPAAAVTLRVRCLHVQERAIEKAGSGADLWEPVDTLTLNGRQLVTWDEAVACEFVRDRVTLAGAGAASFEWTLGGAEDIEVLRDGAGRPAARIVRRRLPVTVLVRLRTERRDGFVRLQVRIENVTECAARTLAARDGALKQSLAGTHTLLSIDDGAFVSLLEPPPAAVALAADCANEHTWPVLVGSPGSRDVMLSSPIILYDYPAVAPESPGDLCDATEIDEMLMLRVQTLTEAEKREGRATDERAAQIIDRADTASPAVMGNLHGAIRRYADTQPLAEDQSWESFVNPPGDAPPESAWVEIASRRIGRGSRVLLRPTHRADSMDICLRGRTATVTGVYRTLEDKAYVAVTVDDDPLAATGLAYRRALFFHPDEVVPLGPQEGDPL